MLQKLRAHDRALRTLLAMLSIALIVALIFAAMCYFSGVKPGSYKYPTYLLQAQAWLRGETALDRNYEYLELAVYNDRYYVSFPPVPSIPMVLWTKIWGDSVPGGLFQKIYVGITCLAVMFALTRRARELSSPGEALERPVAGLRDCMAWALFLCLASAMLPIALVGAVWYEAEIMAFLFSMSAVAAMDRDHPTLSCLLYALSVGCRPFSVCLGPVLLMIYLRRTKDMPAGRRVLRLIPGLLVGLAVAAGYAAYNYVRFGNPLEFGHNYLPEFTRTEEGQFSLSYIANNWRTLFFGLPCIPGEDGPALQKFGFSMFLSCPILICELIWVVLDLVRRRFSGEKLVILLMGALNIFCLLLHRTLGGFQFGMRYALELVPLSFAYLLACPERAHISGWETGILSAGLLFNFIGGIFVHV